MFGRVNKMYAYQPQLWGNQISYNPYSGYVNDQGLNRQQHLPQQYVNPYWNAMPGQWQNQYIPQNYPVENQSYPYSPQWNQPHVAPEPKKNYTKMLFQNPLQPQDDPIYGYYGQQQEYQNFNPYPQQAYAPKQPSGLQSIMNSFKSQEGNLDINKMVDTAGQMVNAVTQVSSLVKGLGGMFKV